MLQETHGYEKDTAWSKQMNREGAFSWYKSNSRGCTVLMNKKMAMIGKKVGNAGRVVSVITLKGDTKIGIISVYGPNVTNSRENLEDSRKWGKEVREHLEWVKHETDLIYWREILIFLWTCNWIIMTKMHGCPLN